MLVKKAQAIIEYLVIMAGICLALLAVLSAGRFSGVTNSLEGISKADELAGRTEF